jgi:hypothetical protein
LTALALATLMFMAKTWPSCVAMKLGGFTKSSGCWLAAFTLAMVMVRAITVSKEIRSTQTGFFLFAIFPSFDLVNDRYKRYTVPVIYLDVLMKT